MTTATLSAGLDPRTAARRGVPATLRGRTRVLGLVLVLVLAAATAVVTTALLSARREQDRVGAFGVALRSSGELARDFLDEDSGLRGYQLMADPQLLTPYRAAVADVPDTAATLRAALSAAGDRAALAALAALLAAHDAWIAESAQPAIDAVAAGTARPVSDEDQARQRLLRTRLGDLQDLVAAGQGLATASAERARTISTTAAAVAGVVVLLALGVVFLALRRWVLAPVDALGRAADDVTAGSLDRPIAVAGPREFRRVGQRVDAMRQELLDHAARTRQATEGLEQHGATVVALRGALEPTVDVVPGVSAIGRLVPAEGVLAGDWFDVVALPDDRLAVVVGDVAGHGPSAGVFALRLKQRLRRALADGLGPAAALDDVRDDLRRFPDDPAVDRGTVFATCFVAVLDPATDTLTWASAGHTDAHAVGDAGPVALGATGPMLNLLLADRPWTEGVTGFGAGTRLVVTTDGVTEARPAGGSDEFGSDRVLAAVGSATDPVARVRAVFAALAEHAGRARDDCTLVLAERLG